MNTKKAQFNFVWLFAILAGGAILFLAIYGSVKTTSTATTLSNTKTAKSLSILTDPLQAGFSEASYGIISFNEETKLKNTCIDSLFGENKIAVATKNTKGIWGEYGFATKVTNRYIFSKKEVIGEDMTVFSKPFRFPYKVADLTILFSKNYCFKGAPEEIQDELNGLNIPNIQVENCTKNSAKTVCFSNTNNCDIQIIPTCQQNCKTPFDTGIIEKKGEQIPYAGTLLYAGIFSDKSNYDCNVNRLIFRTKKIADIYQNKINKISARGCNSNMFSDIAIWKQVLENATAKDISPLATVQKSMNQKQKNEVCNIW